MWPAIIPSFEDIKYAEGFWCLDSKVKTEKISSNTELGSDGFVLELTPNSAFIRAATETGMYYGEDALNSLVALARQEGRTHLECAMATSIPVYAERGVTLSASTVPYSESFTDQLFTWMGKLRLNHLLLEVNIAPLNDHEIAQWPYWRKSEIKKLVDQARQRHIEVIGEVNAPSHMETYLRHHPHLAFLRRGKPDLERLDFTRPEAVDFYLSIVDVYSEVFDSPWWHMGADEFEHGSITYSDFPVIAKRARELFGKDALPQDLYYHFINQVNSGLAKRGKRLRIWNDSIKPTNIVSLDKNIVVEYWQDRGLRPLELLNIGYSVMNSTEDLYWSRSELACMRPKELFQERRVQRFITGWEGSHPNITGLKCSIWPDRAWMQTENEVKKEIRDGLALCAQIAWSHTYPGESWEQLQKVIASNLAIGPSEVFPSRIWEINWQIPVLNDFGGTWKFEPTEDGYVRLRHCLDGKFLSLRSGRNMLGVIVDETADLELFPDIDHSELATARAQKHTLPTPVEGPGHTPWHQVIRDSERAIFEYNCQKWSLHCKSFNDGSFSQFIILRSALGSLELNQDSSGKIRLGVPLGNSIEIIPSAKDRSCMDA